MRALVIYESMFGNTRDVAVAIADGLTGAGVLTEAIEVGVAPRHFGVPPELLVVGAPTHAFSLSRESTRADAPGKSNKPLVSTGIGLREWLEDLGHTAVVNGAAFDTKVAKPNLPGSAAKAMAKRLKKLGIPLARPAETFLVQGMDGPLLDGELERARAWGARLAEVAGADHLTEPG